MPKHREPLQTQPCTVGEVRDILNRVPTRELDVRVVVAWGNRSVPSSKTQVLRALSGMERGDACVGWWSKASGRLYLGEPPNGSAVRP